MQQAERELPIRGQLESLRAFAAQRGYEVVREYTDEGKSGFTHAERRDGLRAMIDDARGGAFDCVAIWKLDRFARNLKDGLTFLAELSSAGVDIVSVTETGATDHSPSGEFQRNLLLAFAEFWSKSHGENVRRGMRAVWARGGWPNCAPPYGYRVERRDRLLYLVRDARESAVVERIYSMAAAGASLPRIAATLNAEGVRTRHGGPWCLETLRHVLRSEVYLGNRVGRFGRAEHVHEPLVTQAVFDAVQELLAARRRLHLHPRMHGSSFLLSPFAFCGLCGARVRGVCHSARYYICSTRARLGRCRCVLRPIRQEVLESRVIRRLREHLLTADGVRKLIDDAAGRRKPRSEDAIVALMGLLRRQRTIVEAISHGADPSRTKLARLTEQIGILEARLAATGPIAPGVNGVLDIARRFRRVLDGPINHDTLAPVLVRVTVRDSGLELRVTIPTLPVTYGRIVC